MNAKCTAAAVEEYLEISAGLCGLDHAECVSLSRNLNVRIVVRRDLQKDAVIAAALICLAGRMQKSWAKSETRRTFKPFED